MRKADELIRIWITLKIVREYELRGVFPELRREHHTHRATSTTYACHEISRSTAYAIMEDAIEQGRIRRGVAGRGLTITYRSLLGAMRKRLGMSIDVERLRWPVPEFDGQCPKVSDLFYRLGIPCVCLDTKE